MYTYKQQFSFDTRLHQSSRVLNKYPDRIPIVCERSHKHFDLPNLDKKKFLVPRTLTFGQFICIIRQKIRLNPNDSIFLFVNDKIVSGSLIIGHLYECEKDPDGMLYLQYTKENTFG